MSAGLLKKARNAKPQRVVSGYVTVSAGTPVITRGEGFTIADTAAGKVTITFSRPGKYIVAAVASPIENTDATGYSAKIMGTPSGTSIVVGTYVADATDGALADNIPFSFIAVLQD